MTKEISAVSVHGLSSPSSGPCACVRYLRATSETPNSTPAAVASRSASPRCSMPLRVEILTSPTPSSKIALSTAIGAALLEQETQVGADRRPQRKDQSQDHRGIRILEESWPSTKRRSVNLRMN